MILNMRPQLAGQTTRNNLDRYILDDNWGAEQKFDGDRLVVLISNRQVRFLNRNGKPKTTGIATLTDAFDPLKDGEYAIDGELISGSLYVFDLPHAEGLCDIDTPFAQRRLILEKLFDLWQPATKRGISIHLSTLATGPLAKRDLIDKATANLAEGVMLKRLDAPYKPGRRADTWLKVKFENTVDAIVTALGTDISPSTGRAKDNCRLTVIDADKGGLVNIGEASTLYKKPVVELGQVWEVKYLYALDPNNPSLVQPRLIRIRTDKGMDECLLDQLIFGNPREVLAMSDQRPVCPDCGGELWARGNPLTMRTNIIYCTDGCGFEREPLPADADIESDAGEEYEQRRYEQFHGGSSWP